jgi:hypothetical protein
MEVDASKAVVSCELHVTCVAQDTILPGAWVNVAKLLPVFITRDTVRLVKLRARMKQGLLQSWSDHNRVPAASKYRLVTKPKRVPFIAGPRKPRLDEEERSKGGVA